MTQEKIKQAKQNRLGDYETIVGFPVWSNYQIHIVFTEDLAKSYKARYRRDPDLTNTAAFHASSYSPPGNSHLFFSIDGTYGSSKVGIFAHECFHAIAELFSFGGVKRSDEEVTAYHLGYLVEKVVEFYYQVLNAEEAKSKEVKHDDSQGTVGGLPAVQSRGKERREGRT
jgi:hypothetical protein